MSRRRGRLESRGKGKGEPRKGRPRAGAHSPRFLAGSACRLTVPGMVCPPRGAPVLLWSRRGIGAARTGAPRDLLLHGSGVYSMWRQDAARTGAEQVVLDEGGVSNSASLIVRTDIPSISCRLAPRPGFLLPMPNIGEYTCFRGKQFRDAGVNCWCSTFPRFYVTSWGLWCGPDICPQCSQVSWLAGDSPDFAYGCVHVVMMAPRWLCRRFIYYCAWRCWSTVGRFV